MHRPPGERICAHSGSASSQRPTTTHGRAAVSTPARNTYAGSTRTVAGATPETLVRVPGEGSLTVSCTPAGVIRAAFTVRARASAVVVVHGTGTVAGLIDPGRTLAARPEPVAAMEQVWQVTPVTEAEVRVATITVASMPAPAAFGGKGCFASALAVTSTAPA